MANAGRLVVTLEASTDQFTQGMRDAGYRLRQFQETSGSTHKGMTALERGFARFASEAVGIKGPLEQISKGLLLFGGGGEAVLGVAVAVTAVGAAMKIFGLNAAYSSAQLAAFRTETTKLRESSGLAGLGAKLIEAHAALEDSSKPGFLELFLGVAKTRRDSGISAGGSLADVIATGLQQERIRQNTEDNLNLLTVSHEREKAIVAALGNQVAAVQEIRKTRALSGGERAQELRMEAMINEELRKGNLGIVERVTLQRQLDALHGGQGAAFATTRASNAADVMFAAAWADRPAGAIRSPIDVAAQQARARLSQIPGLSQAGITTGTELARAEAIGKIQIKFQDELDAATTRAVETEARLSAVRDTENQLGVHLTAQIQDSIARKKREQQATDEAANVTERFTLLLKGYTEAQIAAILAQRKRDQAASIAAATAAASTDFRTESQKSVESLHYITAAVQLLGAAAGRSGTKLGSFLMGTGGLVAGLPGGQLFGAGLELGGALANLLGGGSSSALPVTVQNWPSNLSGEAKNVVVVFTDPRTGKTETFAVETARDQRRGGYEYLPQNSYAW